MRIQSHRHKLKLSNCLDGEQALVVFPIDCDPNGLTALLLSILIFSLLR